MKHPMVRIVLAVWLVAIALIPFVSALAQDDGVDLLEAVGIVRGAYGEVLVYEVEVDSWETAAGAVTCWNFVTDAGEFCISTVDGSILTGDDSFEDDDSTPEAEMTPEATEDAPEAEATEDFDDSGDDNGGDDNGGDDEGRDDEDDVSPAAPVTLTQLETAVAAGLNIYPNSVIREASISTDDDTGVVIIKIEFDDEREVEVNSESGDVVDFGFSGDEDDDDNGGDDDNNGGDDDDNSGSDDDNSGSDDDNSGSDDDNSGSDDDDDGDNDDDSGDDDDDDGDED